MASVEEDLRPVDPPRCLRDDEQELIGQLLAKPFAGRDQARAQLESARVVAEGTGDTGTIRFEAPSDAVSRIATALRVPVEAEMTDADGTPIAVLLHVVAGVAEEVEIYRVDGQPIRRREFTTLRSVVVNGER